MTQKEISLYQAILLLKTSDECERFFTDLCTPQEMNAMKERWRVCQLLEQGGVSYRDINKKTNISLTTIGRVARFLHTERYQGYRLVLERRNTNSRIDFHVVEYRDLGCARS